MWRIVSPNKIYVAEEVHGHPWLDGVTLTVRNSLCRRKGRASIHRATEPDPRKAVRRTLIPDDIDIAARVHGDLRVFQETLTVVRNAHGIRESGASIHGAPVEHLQRSLLDPDNTDISGGVQSNLSISWCVGAWVVRKVGQRKRRTAIAGRCEPDVAARVSLSSWVEVLDDIDVAVGTYRHVLLGYKKRISGDIDRRGEGNTPVSGAAEEDRFFETAAIHLLVPDNVNIAAGIDGHLRELRLVV